MHQSATSEAQTQQGVSLHQTQSGTMCRSAPVFNDYLSSHLPSPLHLSRGGWIMGQGGICLTKVSAFVPFESTRPLRCKMSFIREVRDTIHKGWRCLLLQTSVSSKKSVCNLESSKCDADFINMVPGKPVLQSFQEEECSWYECAWKNVIGWCHIHVDFLLCRHAIKIYKFTWFHLNTTCIKGLQKEASQLYQMIR